MAKRYVDDSGRVFEVRFRHSIANDWVTYALARIIDVDTNRVMAYQVNRVGSSYLPARPTREQAQADLDAWALRKKLKEVTD